MKQVHTRSSWILLPVVACFILGCGANGPTHLCEGFSSYQSVENVRAELNRRGIASEWKEESQGTTETDRRPHYKFIYMSGPFTLSGINGRLKLTFYNGRLMEARFSPEKAKDYIAALRGRHSKVPQKAGLEIVTDVRTRFRFDVDSNGQPVFTWYDPKLENEWNKWVASNS